MMPKVGERFKVKGYKKIYTRVRWIEHDTFEWFKGVIRATYNKSYVILFNANAVEITIL